MWILMIYFLYVKQFLDFGVSVFTECQRKTYHFFRAALTKIHRIEIIYIWIQSYR